MGSWYLGDIPVIPNIGVRKPRIVSGEIIGIDKLVFLNMVANSMPIQSWHSILKQYYKLKCRGKLPIAAGIFSENPFRIWAGKRSPKGCPKCWCGDRMHRGRYLYNALLNFPYQATFFIVKLPKRYIFFCQWGSTVFWIALPLIASHVGYERFHTVDFRTITCLLGSRSFNA